MLDHIVLAGPDLAAAVTEFAELTGVQPVPGGRHQDWGTANHLVGLTGAARGTAYLEIIGPDPDQPDPPRPRPFGIDQLRAPRIVTWAIRCTGIDQLVDTARARGYDPGPSQTMSRDTPAGEVLRWRLTQAQAGGGDGLVPFLIDWGSTPHPTSRGLPAIPLVSFEATHPQPEGIRSALAAVGAELPVRADGRSALIVVLDGRRGRVELS